MNNIPLKISLKSNNLDYCRMLRNKILERLSLDQEEELLNNILKDLELFKKKELLHNKLDLGSFTYNKEDEKNEKIRKQKRAERIEKEFDDKFENIEKVKILKKENNLDKKFQTLEEKLLQKLSQTQQQETPIEHPKCTIFENFDTYYNNYIEHRLNFDKIGKDTIRTSSSSIRYLKFFIDKDTIFNFSFFKELQKKFQQIPKNFFKYDKYYKKSFEEVLKLKEIENYETLNNKTINNHMSKYQTFFDYLLYEEIIKENPLSNIKPLQEAQETPKQEYTQEELDKIFSSEIEKDYLNMCKFAIYTGLRIEEILSIKKEDIKDNLIHLNLEDKTTKKHTRIIPIHKNLLNTIKEQIKANKGDFLFFGGNIENEVKNIGKKVNRRLKNIVESEFKTFHSLRKNFSQELELNTNSEDKIKKYLMGHSFSKDITHMVYNRGKMNVEKLVDCINQITFTY